MEGTQVRKGARSIQPLKKAFQKSEGQDGTEDGDATVDVKRAAEEQWQRQQQSSEELLLMEADKAEGLEEDLATCQEYLRDEREQVRKPSEAKGFLFFKQLRLYHHYI